MALVLLLGSIGMTPARAEAGKTIGVSVGDFVARFNETATQLGYPNQIDTSFVQDNGGANILLTGKLGNYATLIGTVSRENHDMIGVIVVVNAKDKETMAEGASMAYAAMAVAAGTTFQALADDLQAEFEKGNMQKTFGKVLVKAEDLGKLGLIYSAGLQVEEQKAKTLDVSAKDYVNRFNTAMKGSGQSWRLDAKNITRGERLDSIKTGMGEDLAFLMTFSKDKAQVINVVFITEAASVAKAGDELYRTISTGLSVVTPGTDRKTLDGALRKMKNGEKLTLGAVRLSRTENQLGLIFAAESAVN